MLSTITSRNAHNRFLFIFIYIGVGDGLSVDGKEKPLNLEFSGHRLLF